MTSTIHVVARSNLVLQELGDTALAGVIQRYNLKSGPTW